MSDLGSDLSCVTDIDGNGTIVSGRRALSEAIARRLITPRGRLIGDPDYGTDLTAYINDEVGALELATMQAAIEVECLKDERVNSASTTITPPTNGSGIYQVTIELEDGDGPFSLVLGVSNVTIEILRVTT